MRRSLAAILVLILVWAMGGAAQSIATAELDVIVKDPSGRMVTNAKVTVRDDSRGIERTLENKPDGEYKFLSLSPGQYVVTVDAGGFATATATGVRVTVGQAAELPVSLNVSGQKTEMTVSGETEMVETQTTSVSTTINQQRIDNLPINGRNYINFTLLNSQTARDNAPSIGAAPTSGLNIGGQRARANLVNVDGVDAVDNSVNGVRSTVSQEAVQEFQLLTNGYAAEYGRASGGVVNIITRSGTNDLHGNLFGYLRNRDFQAINPFNSLPPGQTPAYTRVQAGATAGGALRKDKTFYFFSYELTRRQETGFSTIGADNFGLVPLANAASFGLPAGSLVTPEQVAVLASAPVSPFTVAYAQLAAGGSAVALLGAHGTPGPLGAFPTTGAPLPQSFANLVSQEGNYPVSEGTTIVTARMDEKFSANHSALLRVNVSPSTVTGLQVQGQNQNFGQNAFSRTAIQQFRDLAITAQETATIGNSKINELRFQYARRGLLFNFNQNTPDGPNVAVNIQGFSFIGREPFSFIRRTEERYQIADNFSVIKRTHNFKFGADFNRLPVTADFTVNFGGVYNFGDLSAGSVSPAFAAFPGFSAVQAYGLGIPQTFIQGLGNPHAAFSNTPVGFFAQDSWRIKPNLTLNYGVRYDVEFVPSVPPLNSLSTAAYGALGITNSIPQDNNNVAPRIGIAWDPWNNGKTVIRASYGLFYDHPLLGLQFLAQATNGAGTPQILLAGGSPCGAPNANPLLQILSAMNATNTFQGTLGNANCLGNLANAFGYDPTAQRFITNNPASLWVNQNYLQPTIPVAPGVNFPTPLGFMPFGFPLSANFQYAYSNEANLGIERDLGGGFALNIAYSFNGGRHLNRPINANAVHGDILFENYVNDLAGGASPSSPFTVSDCGVFNGKPVVPAALVNFFRPSGLNPSLAPWFSAAPATGTAMTCTAFAQSVIQRLGLGVDAKGNALPPVPFSDMAANYSNGSSVYHGLTLNLRKRFTNHYELLTSYTYSHAIDDSTDLESPLSPQNAYDLRAERSNSTFDQRHRLVFSGIYQSGKLGGSGFANKFFSDWTIAPVIEAASGRPFTVITAVTTNFQFAPNSARPNAFFGAPPSVVACGGQPNPAFTSPFIPGVWFQLPCPALGQFDGNLGRNPFTKPSTVFTDLRIARRIRITERVGLDAIADGFNLINKFNVSDVNPLYTEAGQPTAAYDPRQFQFALKLSW